VTEGRRKVLFVATVESHLLNFHIPFMKLLQEKGYEVHVATRLGNRQQEFDEIGVIKHNVDFSRSPYSPKVFKSLQQMEKLLKEIRFSLVHVHTPVAAFVTRLACQRTNTHPVLYTAHGLTSVFNNKKMMAAGNVHYSRHISCPTKNMYGDYSLRSWRNSVL